MKSIDSTQSSRRTGGFVLVLVLVLLALVTILVTVSAILARVERRASWNNGRTELARQNALFALNVALNQLQREAGPDQRVTARADLFSSGSSPSNIAQPYWTGVWKSFNPASGALENLDVDANGNTSSSALRPWSIGTGNSLALVSNTNMVWLVSGGTNNVLMNPASFSGTSNSVVLAMNLPNTTSTSSVSVPLVNIPGATTGSTTNPGATAGRYGYWVSDEGVKAKVTMNDPTLSSSGNNLSYVVNQNHFLGSQANLLTNFLPVVTGSDPRLDPSVTKVSTLQSLSFLPSLTGTLLSGTGASAYSADVTTYSRGVLSDVRNGGLKRDLTAAFESDQVVNPTTTGSGAFGVLLACGGGGQNGEDVYRASNPNLAVPVQTATAIYPGSPTSPTTLDGLRWQSLYDYYNLYKTSAPMWRTKQTGGGTAPAGVLTSAIGLSSTSYSLAQRLTNYNDSIATSGTAGFNLDPIAPVVLEARVDIGLCSFVDPTSGLYRLRLRYYPLLVLYNPYGVRITTSQNTSYNFYTNYFNVNNRWNCAITVSGTGVPPFDAPITSGSSGYSLIEPSGTNAGYPLVVSATAPNIVSFDPGEIKVFALAGDVSCSTLGNPSTTNVCNIQALTNTNPNISADYAQTYDLPWAGTSDSTAKVSVGVTATNLAANVAYENGSPLDEFPDGSQNGASNARFQSLNIPSITPAGSWPSPGPAISTLTGKGYLLVGFDMRSKGILATTSSNWANYNYVLPQFMGNSLSLSDLHQGNWKEVYARAFQPYGSYAGEVQMDGPTPPFHTSWGEQSIGAAPVSATNSRLVLVDVPCQPMVSLGQFSQLYSRYYLGSSNFQNMDVASMFIGGSFASPDLSLNKNAAIASTTGFATNTSVCDHSFMANQVLFDSYFLSTVPAANPNQPSADLAKYPMATGSAALSAAIQNNQPLPNNRMRFYYRNGIIPTATSTPSLTTYISNIRDLQLAAANLLVDGAFNVNSTSVAAWQAFLASLSGNPLTVWNDSLNSSFTYSVANLLAPFPRFWNCSLTGTTNQPWEGMRALTTGSNSQINELATNIIAQIRARGPFLSMGDFLNRRLGVKGPLTEMGALQAAIESSTNPDLNATAKAAGTSTILPAAYTTGTTYAPVNSATGIPGYLMQQDLVQALAPAMTVRSDTFIVRCYGEADNQSSGVTEGRAWCEAVIQRYPEYVDQNDPAITGTNVYTSPAIPGAPAVLGDATPVYNRATNPTMPASTFPPIVDQANLTFGRRFKIISFRWLNQIDL